MSGKDTAKIEIDEVNLEDLIILGDDKLINIKIEYPKKDGSIVAAKAKVKQLTVTELRNLDLEHVTPETSIKILEKTLFKNDGSEFSKQELFLFPIGVVNAIANEILRLSGVNDESMGF